MGINIIILTENCFPLGRSISIHHSQAYSRNKLLYSDCKHSVCARFFSCIFFWAKKSPHTLSMQYTNANQSGEHKRPIPQTRWRAELKSRTRAEGAASNVQTEVQTEVQTYNRFLSTALAMASIDSPVLDKRCSSAHIANRQELVPYFGRLTEAEEQATTVEITGFSHKSVDIYATQYLSQVGETAAAAGIPNNWRCILLVRNSLYCGVYSRWLSIRRKNFRMHPTRLVLVTPIQHPQ